MGNVLISTFSCGGLIGTIQFEGRTWRLDLAHFSHPSLNKTLYCTTFLRTIGGWEREGKSYRDVREGRQIERAFHIQTDRQASLERRPDHTQWGEYKHIHTHALLIIALGEGTHSSIPFSLFSLKDWRIREPKERSSIQYEKVQRPRDIQ